jgi:chromate transporter
VLSVSDPRSDEAAPRVALRDLMLTFAKVGAFGFGGGMGMLAILRENVLDRKRWISEQEFSTAVAMGQMTPGPFIPNCVEYIGYRLRGLKGMVVSALAFLLPSTLAILALSIVYFRYGSVPAVQAAFRGVEPVVAGILVVATWQFAQRSCRNWRSMLIALLAFLALLARVDVLLTIVVCGLLGVMLFVNLRDRRIWGFAPWLFAPWFVPGAFALQASSGFGAVLRRGAELFGVFCKIGAIVWGGGFAAIPFIQHEVVDVRDWLTAKEFIDGVALGQITPGPVAITATFVGYRVLGIAGAALATIGMFLPSFIILLILLRVYDRIKDHYLVKGFLQGIMPAVVGMLLSAALVIGRESITNLPTATLGLISLVLLLVAKLDPIWLVLGGAAVGLVLKGWL